MLLRSLPKTPPNPIAGSCPGAPAPPVWYSVEWRNCEEFRLKRLGAVSFCLLLSLLSYLKFPGHAWLQQDTQIYIPILENLADPSVLANDLVVRHPHVAFTLYDELVIGLRSVTGADFHAILTVLAVVFRAAGCGGVWLIASSLGLESMASPLVPLLWSLGATISGPAVLTVEYEPVPRGFALPLLMLAVGLAAHGRWRWSGIAAGLALMFHPPTVYPYLLVVLLGRRTRCWAPLAVSAAVLFVSAHVQSGIREPQQFLTQLTPALEQLQRLRGSYNWISTWPQDIIGQYLFEFCLAMLAAWRLKDSMPAHLKPFALGLPAVGLVSMPLSYLFLERLKWSLMPQLQPMRALVWISAMAVILASVAGCRAARDRRLAESFAWFVLPWLLPMRTRLFAETPLVQVGICLGFALLSVAGVRWPRLRLAPVALAAFWVLPSFAGARLIPNLHSPELAALSAWARGATPKSAVFLFADNGRDNYPGIFRAEALRAVYVDWKSGGQVNFLPAFADEWWRRWRKVNPSPGTRADYSGIDYLVYAAPKRPAGRVVLFQNSKYAVVRNWDK